MKLLLDTNVLLWAAGAPKRLSRNARTLLEAPDTELFFSAASIWEITIKRALGRGDFVVEPRILLRGLLDNGYAELGISSQHALTIDMLPPIHEDPFDRMIVAQAITEGITLVTSDPTVAKYPCSIMQI